MSKYLHLASRLREHIQMGYYGQSDKLPSVRQLAAEHEVSISTVQEAYRRLEQDGLVEAKAKSGYFVAQGKQPIALPKESKPPQRPMDVSQWEDVLAMLMGHSGESVCEFQHAMPDMTSNTLKPLIKTLYELNRHRPQDGMSYGHVQGELGLREQLSRLTATAGCQLEAEDFVVTSGCQEALSVCLRAVAESGNVIAVESPGFYGAMQAIKAANLKALEIPTDSRDGISIEALKLAMDQWPIKAILVTPTVNNPQGYVMPLQKKQALYQLAREYDIAIIEDDIYGDIAFEYPRPKTIKSFDQDGRVLLCSSFSKTLAPGFRVGWIAPGRYRDKVTHIKYVSSSMCPTLPQLAIGSFIRQGGYDRHLRAMRQSYRKSRDVMLKGIEQHFPQGTRVSFPEGGFILWVELPDSYDAAKLAELAKNQGIILAPGQMFSATGKYRNCLRFNYIDKELSVRRKALNTLQQIFTELADKQALENSI
ncbi:PLP-dependent aminotransferase family protein [Glaciecola sp. 1036]|uniref:aminotransferase-like domain-containing protein n=1 Tax=Alteromonadaceae TaxID=72275 RepID=UPI003CFE1E97